MIYEYDAFIEVPDKLGEEKMAELDCAIANFVEERFGFPVEFSIVGQVDKNSGDCEIEKVVRCKDCKYYFTKQYETKIDVCKYGGGVHDVIKNENHYCGYGERKEDND